MAVAFWFDRGRECGGAGRECRSLGGRRGRNLDVGAAVPQATGRGLNALRIAALILAAHRQRNSVGKPYCGLRAPRLTGCRQSTCRRGCGDFPDRHFMVEYVGTVGAQFLPEIYQKQERGMRSEDRDGRLRISDSNEALYQLTHLR